MLYFGSTILIFTQTNSREQRCSTVFINYIVLLVIRSCLRKSRIANFTVLNLNVNQPRDLSDLFDSGLRVANLRTVGTAVLTRNFQYFYPGILVVYQLNKGGLCSARK